MNDKIKELTDMFSGSAAEEVVAAQLAYKNFYYMQCVKHYKLALEYAIDIIREQKKQKNLQIDELDSPFIGEVCFFIYNSLRFQEIEDPDNEEFLEFCRNEPLPVKCNNMEQQISAVKRKYLRYSADNDYASGVAEFAMACMGNGPLNGCAFPITKQNTGYAIEWANYMVDSQNVELQFTAYVIYSIYYMDRFQEQKTNENFSKFANCILKARKIRENKDYVNTMISDPIIRQCYDYYLAMFYSYREKGKTDGYDVYYGLERAEKQFRYAYNYNIAENIDPQIAESAKRASEKVKEQIEKEKAALRARR